MEEEHAKYYSLGTEEEEVLEEEKAPGIKVVPRPYRTRISAKDFSTEIIEYYYVENVLGPD